MRLASSVAVGVVLALSALPTHAQFFQHMFQQGGAGHNFFHTGGEQEAQAAISDLVVVAEFRDHMYPGLVETGRVENGGGKPFHTVINAENFHALEMLTYTHHRKVDCCRASDLGHV